MANILILDLLRGATRLTALLGEAHELVYTNTLERARSMALHEPFDLIIVGLMFDDSRMYDLISVFKKEQALAHVPIMGFSDEPTSTSISSRDSIEVGTHILGACDYIDTMNMSDPEILERINVCLRERKAVGRDVGTNEKTPRQKREKQERIRKESGENKRG